MLAVSLERWGMARAMLELGAEPDPEVDDGWTPLLLAVDSDDPGAEAFVRSLLTSGASLERQGWNGWTALHLAAAHGRVDRVSLLLECGAPIDARSDIDGGYTPLMEAAARGQAEAVGLLLDAGADTTVRDWVQDKTALELARDAAAGPSRLSATQLEALPTQQDQESVLEEALRALDLDPDTRARIHTEQASTSPAKEYLKALEQTRTSGRFPDTIRLLKAHEQRPPPDPEGDSRARRT